MPRLNERLQRLESSPVFAGAREDVERGNMAENISNGLGIVGGCDRKENDSVAEWASRFLRFERGSRELYQHLEASIQKRSITSSNGLDSESVSQILGTLQLVGIEGVDGIHAASAVDEGCRCTRCLRVRILREWRQHAETFQ